MKIYRIAVDGPAGSGKSTIAKIIADKLNITYLDTGAMYRVITLKFLNNSIDFNDIALIEKILTDTTIEFKGKKIFLDSKDVSDDIRLPIINQNVSKVAKLKVVREFLVSMQRKIAETKSIIMDGRDIASVVLPDSEYKFFLTASIEERATRRFNELKEKKIDVNYEQIYKEIEQRDYDDKNRDVAPLIKTEDAVLIDTTGLSIKQVVNIMLGYIKG